MTLEEEIRELICVMVKNHPKSAYYREPVIGFASASAVSYTHLTLPTILLCRSRWSPYH